MGGTASFKELIVWQKAHSFVLSIYGHTSNFPKDEIYGLSSQFRRAAVSIAANISEGYIKKGKADKLRFLNISQGSLEECRYYCLLSRDLKYIDCEAFDKLDLKTIEISKLLNSYISKIAESIHS